MWMQEQQSTSAVLRMTTISHNIYWNSFKQYASRLHGWMAAFGEGDLVLHTAKKERLALFTASLSTYTHQPCSNSILFEQPLHAFLLNACRIRRLPIRQLALVNHWHLRIALAFVRACNTLQCHCTDTHELYRKGWQDDLTFSWYSTVCQPRKDIVQHGSRDPTVVQRQSRGKVWSSEHMAPMS